MDADFVTMLAGIIKLKDASPQQNRMEMLLARTPLSCEDVGAKASPADGLAAGWGLNFCFSSGG